MACHRLQLSSNKKTAMAKNQLREIGKLLAEKPMPQEEKAKIRAEALIREDDSIEACEILQLSCELLSERMQLISSHKQCPPDLVGVIATVMWASARVEIPELATIRKQFKSKYGKDFEDKAMNNKGGILNERVVAKLSIQPPSPDRVMAYLERSAQECDVKWEPSAAFRAQQNQQRSTGQMGWSVPVARGTGFGGDMSAMTGQEQEVQEQGTVASSIPPPSAPGAFSMPGPAPSGKPPKNNNNNRGFGGGDDDDDGALPTAVAYVPPAATRGTSDLTTQEVDEVDIYVPAPPSAPPTAGKGLPPVAPSSFRARGQDINEEERDDGGSSSSMSYNDLTARFAQLKK